MVRYIVPNTKSDLRMIRRCRGLLSSDWNINKSKACMSIIVCANLEHKANIGFTRFLTRVSWTSKEIKSHGMKNILIKWGSYACELDVKRDQISWHEK